jgi:hypothetical protein
MGILLKKLSFTLTKLENIHIEIVDGDSSKKKLSFTLTKLENIHIEIVDGVLLKKTFLHPNQVGKYSH